MSKMKYNYELLQSLCNIEMLNNDYSGQKITPTGKKMRQIS